VLIARDSQPLDDRYPAPDLVIGDLRELASA